MVIIDNDNTLFNSVGCGCVCVCVGNGTQALPYAKYELVPWAALHTTGG